MCQIAEDALRPGDGQQPGETAQVGIVPAHAAEREEDRGQNAAVLSALFLGCHCVERDRAAVGPVDVVHAVEPSAQDVLEHVRLIHVQIREGRGHWEAEMLFRNTKKRRAVGRNADAVTACPHPIPVDLIGVMVREDSNIADLSDPYPAVQKVLVGMAEQIEQMVRRGKGPQRNILNGNLGWMLISILEQIIQLAVG